jgi:hypothetical protein
MGLSIERAAWLLQCPKHTAGTLRAESAFEKPHNPDCYLSRINGVLYFRINRRRCTLWERAPQEITEARAYRDRRLVELGLMKGAAS